MFGWFRPTCPCDTAAKRWVEDRLQWLSRQFGLHILLERPIILPTSEFFPDPYDGSSRAVRQMFRRVCKYMAVDSDAVEITLFTDRTPRSIVALDPAFGFAAGTWQGGEGPWQPGVIRPERTRRGLALLVDGFPSPSFSFSRSPLSARPSGGFLSSAGEFPDR